MLTLLIATALCMAEPPPGIFLPSAQEAPRGELQLAVGGLTLYAAEDPWALGGPQVQTSWAPTDRVQLNGWLLGGVMASPEWGMVLPQPNDPRGTDGVAGMFIPAVGVRFVALDHPKVKVAPWFYTAGLATVSRQAGARGGMLTLAGLAVEAGGERLRFDASLGGVGWAFPIPGVAQGDGQLLWPGLALALSEAGLTWRINPAHHVRFGVTSVVPGLSWRWTQDHLFTELRLSSAGYITLGSGLVGWRW